MKKIIKRKRVSLLLVGLFLIAILQIVSHFTPLNDFVKGSFMGVGFGLLVTSLIVGKFHKSVL
ncbi:hypothetical protein [Polaribacter sp.]|uniref:hypothetical protein n=1 Tax=Polaribacter sp. TaxID=1920175 RepID=UPI003F6D0130